MKLRDTAQSEGYETMTQYSSETMTQHGSDIASEVKHIFLFAIGFKKCCSITPIYDNTGRNNRQLQL